MREEQGGGICGFRGKRKKKKKTGKNPYTTAKKNKKRYERLEGHKSKTVTSGEKGGAGFSTSVEELGAKDYLLHNNAQYKPRGGGGGTLNAKKKEETSAT